MKLHLYKTHLASLLTLCLGNITYAGTIPESIRCSAGSGIYERAFDIQKLDSTQARVLVIDSYTVTELAKKLGLSTAEGSRKFYAVEFLVNDGEDCKSSSTSPELVHCHGQTDVSFIKTNLEKVEPPLMVTDISFTTSRITTENPHAKFEELRVGVGLVLPDGSYQGEDFLLSHAKCTK